MCVGIIVYIIMALEVHYGTRTGVNVRMRIVLRCAFNACLPPAAAMNTLCTCAYVYRERVSVCGHTIHAYASR